MKKLILLLALSGAAWYIWTEYTPERVTQAEIDAMADDIIRHCHKYRDKPYGPGLQ